MMMSGRDMKDCARQALGDKIFGNVWLFATLACLVYSLANAAFGVILPGAGLLLVSGPLAYGSAFVFLKNARDGKEVGISELFTRGFQDDFSCTFLLGLLTGIFTLLWSLLLIIPGIVKAYSYSLVYYLKIDHPEYDWRTCISESQRLMKGHKMRKFLLDLSFIGWFIVGSFCLGIGTFWADAYLQATSARFYECVRSQTPRLPDVEDV